MKKVPKTNMRHIWHGSIAGKRDTGQRFAVSYVDGMGHRRFYGYSNDREIAEAFMDQIRMHDTWSRPRIHDRQKEKRHA